MRRMLATIEPLSRPKYVFYSLRYLSYRHGMLGRVTLYYLVVYEGWEDLTAQVIPLL